MSNFRAIVFVLISSLGMMRAAPAIGQTVDEGAPEFALSIGYANLSLGSDSVIHDEGALRWEASLTFAPIYELPQLRIGGDVGVSMVLNDSSYIIASGSGG